MKYLVLDLETGIKEYLGRKGSFLVNDIVAIGLKAQGIKEPVAIYVKDDQLLVENCLNLYDYDIMVGHNIKYDLLYLWKYPAFQYWLSKGGKIWDTQLAEYMLTGHQHKFAALRDIAVNKYGCKEREKLMEKYWDQGIDTKDIDKELVLEDVTNDVLDTEQIMLQQVKQSKKEGMYAILMEQMEGLLATTEMEYNGIYQNKDIMTRNKSLIEKEIETLKQEALNIANKYWKSA